MTIGHSHCRNRGWLREAVAMICLLLASNCAANAESGQEQANATATDTTKTERVVKQPWRCDPRILSQNATDDDKHSICEQGGAFFNPTSLCKKAFLAQLIGAQNAELFLNRVDASIADIDATRRSAGWIDAIDLDDNVFLEVHYSIQKPHGAVRSNWWRIQSRRTHPQWQVDLIYSLAEVRVKIKGLSDGEAVNARRLLCQKAGHETDPHAPYYYLDLAARMMVCEEAPISL